MKKKSKGKLEITMPVPMLSKIIGSVDENKSGEEILRRMGNVLSFFYYEGNEVEQINNIKKKSFAQRMEEARGKKN